MERSVVAIEVEGAVTHEDRDGCHLDVQVVAVLSTGERVREDPELASRSMSIMTAVGSSSPNFEAASDAIDPRQFLSIESTFASEAAGEDLGFYALFASLEREGVAIELEQLAELPRSYVLRR